MARLPENASLETQLGYTAQVRAGLGAIDELAPLAEPFKVIAEKTRTARDKRDDSRWKLLGKSARVRVFDSRWDASVKTLSGQAFLLSGKDASKDPYNSLFGTVKAEDATQLGPTKAEAVGNTLMAKVTALGHPLLTTLMGPLKDAQDKLVQADKERDAASDEALAHEVERRKLLKELEAAADLAEVEAAHEEGSGRRSGGVSITFAAMPKNRRRIATLWFAPFHPGQTYGTCSCPRTSHALP